jgi:hypothetical protein
VVKILISLINEHLKKKTPRKITPRSYFFISEAGLTPFEIYGRMRFRQKLLPKTKRLMEVGRSTHRRVYRYLKEMGCLEATEVGMGDDLFHGFADAMIKLSDEEEMPLEIKTVNREEFDYLLKKGFPTWQSYIQLQLYLHYLNKERGKILFIEVNTLEDYVMPLEEYRPEQRMMEFTVKKNPKMITKTLEKFRRLKEGFVEEGVMIR